MKSRPHIELPSGQGKSYPQARQWSVFQIELQCFIDDISMVAVHLHHSFRNPASLQRLLRQLQVFEEVCASLQLHCSSAEVAMLQHWLHHSATENNQGMQNPLPIVTRIERDLRLWFEKQQERFHLTQAENTPDCMLQDIFLREAGELLSQLAATLVQLHQQPDNSDMLHSHLRAMHTLKGSAGMADALMLAHHLHDVEAQIAEMRSLGMAASEIVSEIAVRHDFTRRLIEALSVALPLTWEQANSTVTSTSGRQSGKRDTSLTKKMLELTACFPTSQHLMGQGIAAFQSYLQTLVKEVSVLSLLLEAGSPPSGLGLPVSGDHARDSSAGRRDQSMCLVHKQSVESLRSLRCKLLNSARQIEQNLTTQAGLVHQLERELVLSGMVCFVEIESRLQQLVQHLARATGKPLVLHLSGGATAVERGLLEQLVAPLEHLLRNAAVHGIESCHQRSTRGKPLIGQLHLDIQQYGCELRITLSDDGRGLDLERIRAVSIEKGWFDQAQRMSSEALAELIFHPGFSTSAEPTVLAGRGVGLDVVRTEVRALDGEISVASSCGVGTTFCMRLPQSAALASVLLIQLAGQSYAIDVALVEQILPVAEEDRERLLQRGSLLWRDSTLELHSLSTLLDVSSSLPKGEMNILVLRDTPVSRAIVVEHIVACHEIVVRKCHLPWRQCLGFTGTTLLADGTVTFIVDPVQLISQVSGSGQGTSCDRT
ncbi:chemotaxis protein histidine kinase CheA [Herbaspirillum sp. Sphag1AN]|uniref:chemotaxis protein CheA n=1 Tax=unclassified Herbaspirillum TaxID=2624150 RepID=UPI0016152685|nr:MULTISPECIES: chemotaxis protein CheW [unclassified Herbaspirillum]MBB3214587.1 chemotaxis protein histidine kinase CheA [Herbaspirillum sp. Sphag1AN]MBB3247733.1 chemotaxis protein histidine kinase CheA [Herbaspirillum sp. Sphag64]